MKYFKKYKKDTITFFSSLPGVAETYPILPAGQIKYDWLPIANKRYKEWVASDPNRNHTHVRRCPAIFEIAREGYVVRLPWDIEVSFESGKLEWEVPDKGLLTNGPNIDGILFCEPQQNPPHADDRTVIKLPSSWHVITPPDVKLLFLPIPYPDNYIFESTAGILDPGQVTQVNPQVYWNVRKKTLLKAGTPLMQIIPLTNKKLKLEVREANEADISWINFQRFAFCHTFNVHNKANIIRRLYGKLFK